MCMCAQMCVFGAKLNVRSILVCVRVGLLVVTISVILIAVLVIKITKYSTNMVWLCQQKYDSNIVIICHSPFAWIICAIAIVYRNRCHRSLLVKHLLEFLFFILRMLFMVLVLVKRLLFIINCLKPYTRYKFFRAKFVNDLHKGTKLPLLCACSMWFNQFIFYCRF